MNQDNPSEISNEKTEGFTGLSPEDHGLLDSCPEDETVVNLPPEERWEQSVKLSVEFAESLREKYKNDPLALEEIDMYDVSTEYHEKHAQYVSALKSGDTKQQEELRLWFREHYPLTTERDKV
jgi:hypothetical protein